MSYTNFSNRFGGVLRSVLYSTNKTVTFVRLLQQMRSVLSKGGYTQIPQLTSSHPLELEQDFYLVPPDCQGTRRAVLIGINYEGQQGQLTGCHNDCLNIRDYIMEEYGFVEENIVVLMDDGDHAAPTRSNVLDAYRSVVAQSKSGDAIFCHYSGKCTVFYHDFEVQRDVPETCTS
jgi:metacaspase-1